MLDTIEATACRIYVADLAAYNSGRLRGEWIDLDGKEESDVWNEINAMLANSPESNVTRRKCEECGHYQGDRMLHPDCDECGGELSAPFPSAEEWAIHDHEGFAGLVKSEWPNIGELCELAEFLTEAEEDARRGLLWLVNDRGFSVADALGKAEDVRTYDGRAEDYAAEFVEECYSEAIAALPSFLGAAIDWERVAHDLQLGGEIDETEQEGERFLVTNASEF